MNTVMRAFNLAMAVAALLCPCALAEERAPRHLVDPEEFFRVQDSGDFGFYGSELRSDRVYPLNWIAKMHPKENGQTLFRISRTGGWSRDSFLIVPQANKKGFVIDWHSSRWNRDKGSKGGKGMPEDIITSWYFHSSEDVASVNGILSNKIFNSPKAIGELKVGESGDDYPFLLIERFGPQGYDGYLIPPDLYHFDFKAEAEALLNSIESLFMPEGVKEKPEQGGAANPAKPGG
jgi:hypothetical protein